VAADATPNRVIRAHMPAVGVYPSDAEVASVPGGLPHLEWLRGLTAPLPTGHPHAPSPGRGRRQWFGTDIAVVTYR
jgi:hypothetical protein